MYFVFILDRINFLLCCVVWLFLDLEGCQSLLPCDRDLPFTWTGGTFCWPCPLTKRLYQNSGIYQPKSVIATRAQIYRDDAFIVLPRFRKGVPATLVKINLNKKGCQVCLEPYPNWSFHEEGKPCSINNAVDIFLDSQDILWVLDVGIVNTLEQPIKVGCPKVLAFNVKTGQLMRTIDLSCLALPSSRLQYLVVDYTCEGCPFLYISDAAARSILVYNVVAESGFRVVLPKAVVCGCNNRDVLYLALARKCDGSTHLYFTYLCGNKMFSIDTDFLRRGCDQGQIRVVGEKRRRFVILGTDNGSSIFFRYEGKGDIYKWDTNTCFSPCNFNLVYRGDNCMLATHTMADYKRCKMRMLKSNFHDYIKCSVGCGAVQSLAVIENSC